MTEGDDGVDSHQKLGLGSHPTAGRYSYVYKGRRVHADASQVGDMFAAGLRTWDDPYVADTLSLAPSNAGIDADTLALLPWALTTVSAHSPVALTRSRS